MKKVLLAFDGVHFSKGAFEFARKMNESEKILLTGVFLPQVDFANLWSYAHGSGGPLFIPLIEGEDSAVVQKNIARFEKLCRKHNIKYSVHKDFLDFAVPELTRETRFADIVILGSQSFYENLGTGEPNEYLRDALHATECAVVVVPEQFQFPQNNILAYDGTESSVYAIKQFAYLFPELCKNKTLLVTVDKHDNGIPSSRYIRELAGHHFPKLEILELNIDAKKYFATWASEWNGAILVSGAFNRSAFSELFRKSFVSDVIRDHNLPVFIAHR
jgi:hypothetical protein